MSERITWAHRLTRAGRRLARYSAAAGLSFGLTLGLTYVLVQQAGLRPPPAYAITLLTVFTVNFLIMRYWVYRDVTDKSRITRQLTLCAIVSFTSRLLEWCLFTGLVEGLAVPYLVAVVIVQVTLFAVKFGVYDRWVFGKRAGTPDS
jgi:putative flippase GtrA